MNTAIVLAGGTGSRIGAGIPKQFIEVLGKPLMIYCLEILERDPLINRIVIVCVDGYAALVREYCEYYQIKKVDVIVAGGKDFTSSCMNGMDYLKDRSMDDDNVLIIAADRPFISHREIKDAINVCDEYGSGIPVRKCTLCMFMVKPEDKMHSNNYQRDNLVQIQSPWTFKYGLLKRALEKYKSGKLPLCENYPVAMFAAAGNEVYFVEGDPYNIKITEKWDLILMEQMIKEREKRTQR